MVRLLNLYRFYLRVAAFLLPLVAFILAVAMRLATHAVFGPLQYRSRTEYSFMLLLTSLVWVLAAEHYGVTSVRSLLVERTGLRAIGMAVLATYLIESIVLFFYHAPIYSRAIFVFSAGWMITLAFVMRAIFRHAVCSVAQTRGLGRILIVGTDAFARRTSGLLSKRLPCEIVGYVRLPGQPVEVSGAPIREICDIGRPGLGGELDDIVIAAGPERLPEIASLMRALEPLGTPIRAILDLGDGVVVRDTPLQIDRLHVLDLAQTPTDWAVYTVLKRAFDVAFSVLVLVFASPLLAFIGAGIRLTSGGPVLFAQQRVGLNGRVFPMYKFRTMTAASDPREGDTRWTVRGDPRCTPLGSILRKTSLDELPQFWNVLKGDMSVVGPRPERPHFVQRFQRELPHYGNRHQLKVGITGWAQVNGWRGDSSIQKRVEYDLYYMQNWTFAFDLKIVLLTFAALGKQAY